MNILDPKKKKYIELVKRKASYKKSKSVVPKLDNMLDLLKVVFL